MRGAAKGNFEGDMAPMEGMHDEAEELAGNRGPGLRANTREAARNPNQMPPKKKDGASNFATSAAKNPARQAEKDKEEKMADDGAEPDNNVLSRSAGMRPPSRRSTKS